MSDLTQLSAVNLRDGVAAGDFSCHEVVSAHLDKIDEINPKVNALVSLRSRADILADATAADAAGHDPAQPLRGLPTAIKDLQDVAGLPTRRGSLTTNDRPARANGLLAERIQGAGAIIVGKTNTPEFGTGSQTFNEVFGATRNPWNLDRTAGGSSGGAAVALSTRMLPIADGSDLGGSLRNPAAFCNVVGLRPSLGRVPSRQQISTHLIRLGVEGPMGRSVGDTALLLDVLSGPHPLDPISHLLAIPVGTAVESPRVGWLGDLGLFTAERQVLELCHATASRVTEVGGSVQDVRPDLTNAMTIFRTLRGLAYRSLGGSLSSEQRDLVKATVLENIEFGETLTADDVIRAEAHRVGLHAEMTRTFEDFDVLALPSAQVEPFSIDDEFPTHIEGREMADYLEWMTTCCVITSTGCPAISIPAGFSDTGLPVGLQLVAPVGREDTLLAVAAAIESTSNFHTLIPPLTHGG